MGFFNLFNIDTLKKVYGSHFTRIILCVFIMQITRAHLLKFLFLLMKKMIQICK